MADVFAACRPRLLGVAYGMLGELGEAEDVVQDAWLRWQRADTAAVRSAEAFLVTVTTRLALDRLRSARARRETYVGPWLPEPLVVDEAHPEALAIEASKLSLALLGALERLNPVERAVLLLRDVFDLEYAEIADIVDKTSANCRQLAKRAREHAGDARRRHPVTREQEERLLAAFMTATSTGDLHAIQNLLSTDAVLYSDGGGDVTAARKPIYGATKIARFLLGVQRKTTFPPEIAYTLVRVNGDPGVRMDTPAGPLGVLALELSDHAILNVRIISNPHKLAALRACARSRRAPPSSNRP